MLIPYIGSITALALALSAQVSIPGWSASAIAAPVERKCTAKTHRHVKATSANPVLRGAGGAQQRRSPDVQILTFGP
jgi:hypothetical protein